MLIDHVIGGKYRITELIGQGGMGTVFEAVHTGTGSRVAIKLIVSNDIKEEVFVRFQREARAAGTIDSHHIVRIFDMGTDDRSGSPYMVMERLYGEDVSQLMRRVGALSPQVACALACQAALGLAKAHESGVVHRDIKPANLFLHDGGDAGELVVKILDFGIAKVLMDALQKSEEGGLTRTGSMLGSPHYMSPEQAQGLRSIDHRSDIWSLGVVLYKMLCGQTPHAHLQTLGQVILAICSQPARPVQELAPWIPPDVARVVHRALQPDPAQRWQSAYEMFSALQQVMPGNPAIRRVDIAPLSSSDRMRVQPSLGQINIRSEVSTNGSTQHGMTQSPVAAPPTPARSSGFVIGMVAAALMATIGFAGIGVVVMKKKPHDGGGATASASASASAVVATTGGDPTAAPSAEHERERTVSLAISPANATVEVDGNKRDVVDGVVQIKGVLGGVATVRVSSATGETTQSVAITEGGAIPPKIALAPKASASAATTGTGPRVSGTKPAGTGGATGKPTTAPTGTTLNAQRTFE